MRRESERTYFELPAGAQFALGSEVIVLTAPVECVIEKGIDEVAVAEMLTAAGNSPAMAAGRIPAPEVAEEPVAEAPAPKPKAKGRPKKAK